MGLKRKEKYMNNSLLIKKLVGVATLTALVVALQFLSNYVKFGTVEMTLALIPIAVGAILYGPLVGGFLGFIMGVIVIFAPGTQSVFMPVNPFATVVICLFKSAIAGLASGFVFKLFAYLAKKVEDIKKKGALFAAGVIVAALIVPLVNTTLFIIGALLFFMSLFGDFTTLVTAVITINFAIEFTVSAIASPALVTLVKILAKNYNLGFANDFDDFLSNDENVEEAVAA